MIATLGKVDGVEHYQVGVGLIVRAAKPDFWLPAHRVRLRYSYYLKRDIDCDNMKKAMNDAIAMALGCDDKIFLSCDVLKVIGEIRPRVEVEVQNEDEDGHRGLVRPVADP